MLIYHIRCNAGSNGIINKFKAEKTKKDYKSVCNRKHCVSQSKTLGLVGQKKRKPKPKVSGEKLSKKNRQFLEGLGLEVKQSKTSQ